MGDDHAKVAPRATYRLQFTRDFGFRAAAALAPYLADLGISHVYASPYLKARPGSTHGYDVVSHTDLNPEFGDADDFAAMVAAFKDHGLGQILDFVPNHMGVGGSDNPWWLDVLEWGQDSDYAGWFDIDWRSEHRYLQGKVLVPFLGDHYGAVLESGAIVLKFDREAGTFAVWAYDQHKMPINPLHYGRILGNRHAELERLGDEFANLTLWRPQIVRRANELKSELAERAASGPDVMAAVQQAIDAFNGHKGDLETWSRLDALMKDQSWRLAHFRVAADDINYRRFFNINDLAGIRMELPELFDHAHSLVFRLLADGAIDGIRLDHIDGLLDPKAYCRRLREKAPRPFYLLVEKILAAHESLRADWGVDGTTGYEFANLVTGLLVDPVGEDHLTRFYSDFTGSRAEFGEIVRACKLHIMEDEMGSELNVLAREAGRVARSNPRTADFTDSVLRRALQQIIACFPVYRTYIDGGPPAAEDRRDIDWAIAHARRFDSALDASVFDFLHGLLTGDLVAAPRSGFSRAAVIRVAMRAQQYSGPVMAKGLEDTAFYRYNRLLALNEVGGHPDHFAVSIAAFHHANAERARRTPLAMLATSTHDTKRGEDARARIAVLSELGEEWTRHVEVWHRILRGGASDDTLLDTNDEYVFYQSLVGSWPAGLSTGAVPDAADIEAFRPRIEAMMIKAMREAKVHTTWASPNAAYEDGALDFVRRALDASRKNPFLDSFATFQERVALLGVRNSLVQVALKLTVPGMPDIYQGAEFWDLSMVDPDNRRPVDFSARSAALADDTGLHELKDEWRSGRIKLRLTHRLLALRRTYPSLFQDGSYHPLTVSGPQAERVCAFARTNGSASLLVAVSLYPRRDLDGVPWEETAVHALEGTESWEWRNVLDGSVIAGASLHADRLFANLPVAVLVHVKDETSRGNSTKSLI